MSKDMKRYTMFANEVIPGDRFYDDEMPGYGAIVTAVEPMGQVVEVTAVDFNRVYRRRLFNHQLVHIGVGRI